MESRMDCKPAQSYSLGGWKCSKSDECVDGSTTPLNCTLTMDEFYRCKLHLHIKAVKTITSKGEGCTNLTPTPIACPPALAPVSTNSFLPHPTPSPLFSPETLQTPCSGLFFSSWHCLDKDCLPVSPPSGPRASDPQLCPLGLLPGSSRNTCLERSKTTCICSLPWAWWALT